MPIPHVFHQIWVGPDPFPEVFARHRQTWLDHHPGWELRFWTEANLPDGLRNPAVYERIRSPVERSDILRLELLWKFGGVYVDTDFECLRSIEPLIEDLDFFAADIEQGRVNNAIIGSVAGHQILDRALGGVRPREFYGYDKDAAGPLFFDRVLKDYPDAKVFEKRLFYAKEREARKHGYAIHHAANTWKDAELLVRDVQKARLQRRRARAEAAHWRSMYEQSEAKVARVRRVLAPILRLRRLLTPR